MNPISVFLGFVASNVILVFIFLFSIVTFFRIKQMSSAKYMWIVRRVFYVIGVIYLYIRMKYVLGIQNQELFFLSIFLGIVAGELKLYEFLRTIFDRQISSKMD